MKGILIIEVDKTPSIKLNASPLVQRFWKKDDKDFKIVVGDEGNVMIHKCFISARCDSFEAKFRSNLEEAKMNTLKIIDFRLKTVKLAVAFLFDRDIFQTLDLDGAFELLRFADKHVIDDLEDKLITCIFYRISPSTICGLINLAIASNSLKLLQFCFNFMMIFFIRLMTVDYTK